MNFRRSTLTPSVSAACGASPQERSRSPNGVRHSTHQEPTSSSTANTVRTFTLVVSARRMPATSATSQVLDCSSDSSQSPRPGIERNGNWSSGGDWVGPPPGRPVKVRTAR